MESVVIDGLTYRLFEPASDLQETAKLFQICFEEGYWNGNFSRYLEWMDASPGGRAISVIACDDDTVVGTLNFVREQVVGLEKSFQCVQAGGAMTHPEYRRRGIYSHLSTVSFAILEKLGIDAVFGYTFSQSVLEAELKIGYELIGTPQVFVFPLRPAELLATRLGLAPLANLLDTPGRLAAEAYSSMCQTAFRLKSNIAVEVVPVMPCEVDGIVAAKKKLQQLETIKDSSYLNWKYRALPTMANSFHFLIARRKGQVVGYAVCGIKELNGLRCLAIYDVGVLPADDASDDAAALASLIRFAFSLGRESNASVVASLADVHSLCSRVLKRCGFIRARHKYHAILKLLSPDISSSVVSERLWRHTWGSMDYF